MKPPEIMTASAINRELDRLDARSLKLSTKLIAAGRGRELPAERMAKTDPLSKKYNAIALRRESLRFEIELRYGPGAPSRLPRGFGPRSVQ